MEIKETEYAVAQSNGSPDELSGISWTAAGILLYVRRAIPGPYPTFTLSTLFAAKSDGESREETEAAVEELVAADLIRVIK